MNVGQPPLAGFGPWRLYVEAKGVRVVRDRPRALVSEGLWCQRLHTTDAGTIEWELCPTGSQLELIPLVVFLAWMAAGGDKT